MRYEKEIYFDVETNGNKKNKPIHVKIPYINPYKNEEDEESEDEITPELTSDSDSDKHSEKDEKTKESKGNKGKKSTLGRYKAIDILNEDIDDSAPRDIYCSIGRVIHLQCEYCCNFIYK